MKILNNTFPIPTNPTWEIIDGSKLKTFATCPRQFFYEYILGWRREAPNNHLIFGSAWHLAMEQLLLGGFGKDSFIVAYEAFEKEYRETFGEDTDALFSPKNPIRCFDALVDYAKRYREQDAKYEILETEIAGTVVLTEKYVLHYRMDSIIRDPEIDLIHSMEHKTAGNFNQAWSMQWSLAFQVWIYTHVLYCLYAPEQVRGVLINGTAFRKVKDDSKAMRHDFLRVPCWKTPENMQAGYETVLYFMDQLHAEYEMLAQSHPENYVLRAFPMNPESCTKYFGCTWHDYCIAWPNPLRRCDHPPIGFKEEWWDPSAREAKHTHDIVTKGEQKNV